MTDNPPNSARERENLRAAYEFARETRGEADTILWEVAAIVWGAQTLLLGFVLEATGGKSQALILILFVSVVGVLMAVFNEKIMRTRSYVCLQMVKTLADLEQKLQMDPAPQKILSSDYPKGLQRKWASFVNYALGIVWGIVFVVALVTLACRLRQ